MRYLMLFSAMFLYSCGPLQSTTMEKNYTPDRDSANELEEGVIVAQSGKTTPDVKKKTPSQKKHVKQNKHKKYDHKPHQSPGQHKKQSPHQGKTAPTLEVGEINYSGIGCAEDTMATNISDDGLAFTLLFSEFSSFFDPEDMQAAVVQDCSIDLSFVVPHGWRFTILTLDYRGFAEMEEGDSGDITTKMSFEDSNSVTMTSTIEGEVFDDFEVSKEVGLTTNSWIGCDEDHDELSINIALTHKNTSGEFNELTLDSIDGEMKQKFAVVWDQCN